MITKITTKVARMQLHVSLQQYVKEHLFFLLLSFRLIILISELPSVITLAPDTAILCYERSFGLGEATKRRRLGYQQHSSFFSRQISNEFLLQTKSL